MSDEKANNRVGVAIAGARMRLAHKFTLLLVLASLVVGAGSFVILERILSPSFAQLEQNAAQEQLARGKTALLRFNEAIRATAKDYAVWTATFDYVKAPNKAYEHDMFNLTGLINADIDMMGIIGYDGTVLASVATDKERTRLDSAVEKQLFRIIAQPSFGATLANSETAGAYLRSDTGIFALQMSRIRNTEGGGNSPAFYIMGRRLNAQGLTEALQSDVKLVDSPTNLSLRRLTRERKSELVIVHPNRIETVLGLKGIDGEVLATVGFSAPRTISTTGKTAIHSATLAMALSFAALAIVIALGVNRLAVKRLTALQSHISRLSTERAETPKWISSSSDEIGDLARQFDRLNEELKEAEGELRQQSYVQGKADSAVGLLHNVRNALGPLQVKYDKWHAEDSGSLVGQLGQALQQLDDEKIAPERREAMEKFLRMGTSRLVEKTAQRAEEIEQIKSSIDQIVGILSHYDFDSSVKIKEEAVDIADMIRREVANLQIIERRTIELDLPDDIPLIWANHLHLGQLVSNLLRNAVESMRQQGEGEMQLKVNWRRIGSGKVEIEISDNGAGVDPEIVHQVFERGFSTRHEKSGGMGLHWSANAARKMKGELRLESPGTGKGATVRLRLPVTAAADRAADTRVAA